AIKADCGIDVIGSLDSAAIGLDSNNKGTIVVAFRGTGRAQIEACMQKRSKAKQKPITITTAAGLTKYSGVNEDKAFYLRWIGSDVAALSTTPDDKDATVAATKGGLLGDGGLRALSSVNTNASVWAVSNKQGAMPGNPTGKMNGLYGSANLANGT